MQPQQIATITQERLSGNTYQEIATRHGVNKSTICRALNKDEIKEILATGMEQQIALVPKALDRLGQQLDSATEPIVQGAIKIVLANTGLSPNQSTSITLTQILNVHAQEVPASIMRVISGIQANDTPLAIGKDEDVIDV